MEQTGHLNNDFRTCLSHLMTHGTETSPRGSKSREILNYNITLQNPRNRVITFAERNTNTKYLLGEFIWYLTGSNDPAGILPYSKFWDNIRNTNNLPGYPAGTVNSNYGNRLFGISDVDAFYGINQWKETIDLLTKDKDSRQAIMNIHVPSDRHNGNKDVACTLTLQFLIRENKLHMITNMRSNDIILGFTNDVFQFTMLQECLMLELRAAYPQLELGHYYHNAGSMHVYERHYEMAQKIVSQPNAFDLNMIPMDRFDESIRMALIHCEAAWRAIGSPEAFDFATVTEWMDLTPYWKTLMHALLLKDEDAMHALFAMPDDNVPIQMID
jgi:thymidylate synthase